MAKYNCPICGMGFDTKEEHEQHHIGVHSSPKGDITCIACGYTSRDQRQMEEHERVHTGMGM